MLKTILSIAGRPGLFRLVNRGKNMLIVEAIATGKRTPAYAHDKVISLGDISIYTNDGDIPLGEVLEKVKVANNGAEIDIKKLPTWYNLLLAAGISEFVEKEEGEAENTDEKEVKE